MACSNCGNQSEERGRFCRKCGADLKMAALATGNTRLGLASDKIEGVTMTSLKDPDELTGNGIGSVIMGDGFLMVAVILSATDAAISSLLWLLLLIPAFIFFGKGFSDVLQARQIRRRLKQNELADITTVALPPPRTSVMDVIKSHTSGELLPAPSVHERTTRELE
jgi:hypothetical protein